MDKVLSAIAMKDIVLFKEALAQMPPPENTVWVTCPMVLIVETFVDITDKVLGRMFIQELILWGFDKSEACECLNNEYTFEPNSVGSMLKDWIETFDRPTSRPENVFTRPVIQPKPQAVSSDYSPLELKFLQAAAKDLNIHYTTNTHLSMKIISTLRSRYGV